MKSLFLALFIFPFALFSQVKLIFLNVNFEKIESGDKVIVATVNVVKDGKEIQQSVLQNGRFKYKLDVGSIYKIYFSKVNHVTKHLLVDTRSLPREAWKYQLLKVTMTFFVGPENDDLAFLNKTPVGIAQYDEQHKKLRWDYEYAFLINEKIGKVLYQL